MFHTRVIPVLLYENGGLVKTIQFDKRIYIGDPINAIKVFNEKEVNELIFIDIEATRKNSKPNIQLIKDIASECFMPLCYGGGITTIEEIKSILYCGVEKVCLGYTAYQNPQLIKEASQMFGNQSIIVSIDVKMHKNHYTAFVKNGKMNTHQTVLEYAKNVVSLGAGEILLQNINNDGKQAGYDLELVKLVANAVEVPVIACSGAGSINDFEKALGCGASAVAAGSLFVLYGPYNAVLINTPTKEEMNRLDKLNTYATY